MGKRAYAGEIAVRQEDWDKVWRDKATLLEALERMVVFFPHDSISAVREARAAIRAAKGETAS